LAGVLTEKSGPTRTVALHHAADKPALGTGDPALATAADQRGALRDNPRDLGANEQPANTDALWLG